VPVNAAVGSGNPTTFSVHGISVSADPAAVIAVSGSTEGDMLTMPSTAGVVTAGDRVLVRGAFAAGTLTVAAPSGTSGAVSRTNFVADFGVSKGDDHEDF
ncbi:MAG: hypothetical protein KGJ30_11640, partial [Burkholderiales bacterium]|nr:hypothetical protein [Burkholderiales bacterium]